MKKIFTLSILVTLLAFTFTGCGKNGYYYDDESYWLSILADRAPVIFMTVLPEMFLQERLPITGSIIMTHKWL